MIVVDASALVDALLRMPAATAIERYMFAPGQTLHVPHLIDVEVAQAVRRHMILRNLDEVRAQEAISDLAVFPLQRYPHNTLLNRIWELKDNISAYDAVYVALAEALDAPLLTCDQKLATNAQRHVRVELV